MVAVENTCPKSTVSLSPQARDTLRTRISELDRMEGAALETLEEIRQEKRDIMESLLSGSSGEAAGGEVEVEMEEKPELIGGPTIAFAVQVAQKIYGSRFEGRSLPVAPSAEAVERVLARPELQEEIAGRTEPTLRLTLVDDNGTLRWRPVILDGPQEMPLEQYTDQDVTQMSREQRILASRTLNKHPEYRKELPHDDMTLYDLLAYGAAAQGKPIDQSTWTMLTAKFNKGEPFVWGAGWGGGRSRRVRDHAGIVCPFDRLRFAVWGDVIS